MKKIIISSIAIGLVLIVGVSALVLSLIPNGINNVVEKPNEIIIVCSQTKDLSPTALNLRDRDNKEKDKIANIYSYFCHAFEQNTLSAIINGELNKDVEANYLEKGTKSISSNKESEEKITICFKYNNFQKINNFDYSYLFFEISNIDERVEVVLGVRSSQEILDNDYYFNYFYTGKANFKKLYDYVLSVI